MYYGMPSVKKKLSGKRSIQTLMLKSVILKMILLPKKCYECNITPKTIRSDNVSKLIFAHLDVNSIKNKFSYAS